MGEIKLKVQNVRKPIFSLRFYLGLAGAKTPKAEEKMENKANFRISSLE